MVGGFGGNPDGNPDIVSHAGKMRVLNRGLEFPQTPSGSSFLLFRGPKHLSFEFCYLVKCSYNLMI